MKRIENLCNLVVKFVSDKRAQSAVLGFVIIMGIVLTVSLILVSLQIPEQTKKFEAEHASKVPQDFAALSSAIDVVALSGDETASATCDFGMAPETVPFLGIRASGGTLISIPVARDLNAAPVHLRNLLQQAVTTGTARPTIS